MKKIKVMVSFPVEVEYEDSEDDSFIQFDIEENSCPGTGRVGAAVRRLIEKQFYDSPVCLMYPDGTNKIIM